MAARKSTAAARHAWLCFEDEAGQGLRPPKAKTWGRCGQTPVARVRGRRKGRISIAGMTCHRPGERSRLIYRVHTYRGRKHERKSFAWTDYRDLLIAAHHQLPGGKIVLLWDNLNVHLMTELQEFIADNTQWLTVFRFPAYAPELNPAEGVWSLLKRAVGNFAATSLDHLLRVLKRRLKKIQYRPHLIDGCLAETGLVIELPHLD